MELWFVSKVTLWQIVTKWQLIQQSVNCWQRFKYQIIVSRQNCGKGVTSIASEVATEKNSNLK